MTMPEFKAEVAGQVKLYADGTGVISSQVFEAPDVWWFINTEITWALAEDPE